MCWTILGTLIVAACAGFAGRFGRAIGTMVMAGSYVWAAQSSRTTVDLSATRNGYRCHHDGGNQHWHAVMPDR